MQQDILIALISSIALVLGALVGILGQFLSNSLDHRRKIDFLVFETFFKQRLSYLERLSAEIEKVEERHTKILVWINHVNKSFSVGNIKSRKLTSKEIKKHLENILVQIAKENLEDYKPSGKALYFADNSPINSKLSLFIPEYSNTLILVRTLIDKNLNDVDLISQISSRIQQDLDRAKQVLDEIRKEVLFKNKR